MAAAATRARSPGRLIPGRGFFVPSLHRRDVSSTVGGVSGVPGDGWARAHVAPVDTPRRPGPQPRHRTNTAPPQPTQARQADPMRIRPIAATVSLLLALTACGAADNPPATPSSKGGAEAATATTTPAAETSSQPPAATTEPSTSGPLALGTTHTWEDTENGISGTSTVLSYQQGIKSVGSAAEQSGTPGYIWAALELKVCSIKGLFAATTTPWTLSYADGARIEPSSSTWPDFPKPQFPIETKLTPGKCVRGKVVYPVPGNSRPQTVVYAPDAFDAPVEWAVPTK